MYNKLLKDINESRYVSFDIFDTAVLRSIRKPTDVFSLINRIYKHCYNNRLAFDFERVRIESERLAREKAWKERGHSETNLDEIYVCMTELFGIDPRTCSLLKKLETKTEIGICVRNSFIHTIFNYVIKVDKKAVFTSDIYLPEDIITQILVKAGYTSFSGLFISSSYGVSKAAGGLYEIVFKNLDTAPQDILHIGDNYDSDIKAACRYGIRPFHYKKCLDAACENKKFKKEIGVKSIRGEKKLDECLYLGNIIKHFFSHRQDTIQLNKDTHGFWYELGYKYVGVFFFGFITWLIDSAAGCGIENLYFLSRDGHIMKRAYDLISPFVAGAPPAQYMYASRRAWNIPAITSLDDKTMNFLVSGTSTLTVGQFLERIGFDPATLNREVKDAGFADINHQVVDGRDYANLRRLYGLLGEKIREKVAQERKCLLAYFDRLGLFEASSIGIVDIGWHGTLQRSLSNLAKFLGKQVDITGFYVGTFPEARSIYDEGHKMAAFLCEHGEPDYYHQLVKLCVEIFEFIHSAPHGSVIRFRETRGTVVPVFEDNDFEKEKTAKALELQEGALDFIKDFTAQWRHFPHVRISKKLATGPLKRVLENPSYEEAVSLGDLEHAEGFGDVYVKRFIARPSSLAKIIFPPQRLIKEYRSAFWKTGYRKRLFSLKKFP